MQRGRKMELEDVAPWAEAFTAFCARFNDVFARSESGEQLRKYLRGLVAPLERKTIWQLAELAQETTHDRMQRLHNPSVVGRRGRTESVRAVRDGALWRYRRDRGVG